MALDAEFKKHLHSLMVEVYEQTVEETVKHKNQLVYDAYKSGNGAAPPIAYKDAKLYAMKLRVGKTIEKYIEAVGIWGFTIDAAFEREMIQEFWSLTAGPNQFDHPPMMGGHQQHIQAVQASFARERSRLASQLVREGTNRLKELKMKNKRQQPAQVTQNTTNNISFHAPVQNAFVNSPHSTVHVNQTFAVSAETMADIDHLSEGNAELQSAALEVRKAQGQGGKVVDALQKWVTLANAVTGLAGTIHQQFPRIVSLVEWLKQAGS